MASCVTLKRKAPCLEKDLSVEERQKRSRERNREHARRTRLRKKAQLASLQLRVTELQTESKHLEQALIDCTTAKILLGMSSFRDENTSIDDFFNSASVVSESSSSRDSSPRTSTEDLVLQDDDSVSDDGMAPRTTIHWKNGYALDEHGHRKDLTPDELDSIRRERNRLHAKLTRDRKKVYIETLSRAITDLEDENQRLRSALATQLQGKHLDNLLTTFGSALTSALDAVQPTTKKRISSDDLFNRNDDRPLQERNLSLDDDDVLDDDDDELDDDVLHA